MALLIRWTEELIKHSLTNLNPLQKAAIFFYIQNSRQRPTKPDLQQAGFDDRAEYEQILAEACRAAKPALQMRGIRRFDDLLPLE